MNGIFCKLAWMPTKTDSKAKGRIIEGCAMELIEVENCLYTSPPRTHFPLGDAWVSSEWEWHKFLWVKDNNIDYSPSKTSYNFEKWSIFSTLYGKKCWDRLIDNTRKVCDKEKVIYFHTVTFSRAPFKIIVIKADFTEIRRARQ